MGRGDGIEHFGRQEQGIHLAVEDADLVSAQVSDLFQASMGR